ncbi:putative peptidoglycan glycosyltransferase FtsW [Prochlorococcus sp. MIT 1223]|uniref:FtsW/RodA/SpoVE family cell cycle protein n=1 Tax=Prochlorococcus sp. MIT 1223 TaxID=3096217 RepID=UPI002A759ED9|nr:putative peptidoglycan glycosyltransferase FtsW [Prochlorococcus sp. MIT 1223]
MDNFLPLPWKTWPIEARLLLGLIAFWSITGIFVLGSSSWWVAIREMGDGAYYIKRQLIWLLASSSLGFLAISTKLRVWIKIAGPILIIGLLMVGATTIFGSTINGSTRWLIIGQIQIQPSELIKPFVILQAANLFGYWNRISNRKKIFWLGIFGTLILLIVRQPNLSTAALNGILIWIIALAAGVTFDSLFFTALLGAGLGIISISINEYQRLRVMSFLNPWQDPEGNGYQLIQSLLAIGSGGWFGEGYGLSTQKLQYLPIQSTDFIYAVFAEEFGFIGSAMLLFFLLLIAFIGLKISLRCKNNYSKLIAIGCSAMLVGQSIMHIAVTSGAMPTTGLPMPLMSYGGNSLISSILISALLIRCALESYELTSVVTIKKRFKYR